MARVSGASTLALVRRLRRLLSDTHRAPTRNSVFRMLLLRLVAMGASIGCLRKEGSTLPCCSSGCITHGASSFLSSDEFAPSSLCSCTWPLRHCSWLGFTTVWAQLDTA